LLFCICIDRVFIISDIISLEYTLFSSLSLIVALCASIRLFIIDPISIEASFIIRGYEDKVSSNNSLKPSITTTSLYEEKPVTSIHAESADEMKFKGDRIRDPLTVKEENSIRERFKQDLGHSKSDVQYVEVEEYFVKYRNFSYLHCEWKTEDELFKGDKRISAKLKRFKQKMAHHANIFENVSLCFRKDLSLC